MGNENKMQSTRNNKKQDGKFRSKHVKHDLGSESSRAVFGANGDKPESKE